MLLDDFAEWLPKLADFYPKKVILCFIQIDQFDTEFIHSELYQPLFHRTPTVAKTSTTETTAA
jgi:hypothetical protein